MSAKQICVKTYFVILTRSAKLYDIVSRGLLGYTGQVDILYPLDQRQSTRQSRFLEEVVNPIAGTGSLATF